MAQELLLCKAGCVARVCTTAIFLHGCDSGGDAAPPAPRTGAANVADAFGASVGRALAPYAAGLAVLAVALAALRELFAPVEKVARQALSLALLVAVVAFCVDHWDAVYGGFQVVSGEKPLFAWPF